MKLLDLFCGAGGAAMGYHQAGFDEIVGIDVNPQPHYPFEFVQADAMTFPLGGFDLVHASPPCQGYMKGSTATGRRYPQLIQRTRTRLLRLDSPFVIENIVQAAPALQCPIRLCGEMFGLGTIRHRLFETSFDLAPLKHQPHRGRVRGWRHGEYFDGPYVAIYGQGGGKASEQEAQQAMGIDWMDLAELREAIPPAYTRFIAEQWKLSAGK